MAQIVAPIQIFKYSATNNSTLQVKISNSASACKINNGNMSNKFVDPKYTAICSERTLQSNNKGFFLDFAEHVAEQVGQQWIKNTFGKLKSDSERIRVIYDEKEPVCNFVEEILKNVQEIYRKKDGKLADQKRIEAEKESNPQKALVLLSQAVLRAPNFGCPEEDSPLGLSLLSRAKVLLESGEFNLALNDVQLALKECNLQEKSKILAYWTLALCYKALNENKKFAVASNITKSLLKNNVDELKVFEKALQKNYSPKKKISTRRAVPEILSGKHQTFPNASKKITVKQSATLGRYVVANNPIKTGETLVVEEPYSACLLPEKFGTHCHHCFVKFESPIGCTDCCSLAFCSTNCRNMALNSYHKYECKFLDLLIGSGMSILGHTALRMVTQFSLAENLEKYANRTTEKVFSLCTNAGSRSPEDFFQRTLMAAFLLRCLQKSGFFGEGAASENALKIGEMLLFNLQMLQFNAHEIYETWHGADHRFRNSKASYIGVAIYPTVALFNHDCYPAVTRYFVGKKIVLNAMRPLSKNDVIGENYGPFFQRKTLMERQRSLSSRYWFQCQCNACSFNWPSLDTGLAEASQKIRCANTKCDYYFSLPLTKTNPKCPKCKKQGDLGENLKKLEWCCEQFDLGFELMDKEQPWVAIEVLCKAIDLFHSVSCAPHRGAQLAQETLRACLADSGNVYPILVNKV